MRIGLSLIHLVDTVDERSTPRYLWRMKANEFVGHLFLARDVAHSVHLSTRSYATHKALQKFYEGLPELVDTFVEAYQGRYELIGPVALQRADKNDDIVEFLTDQVGMIESARYDVCDESETAIQNLIDEIVAHYYSTLYKLRFLS